MKNAHDVLYENGMIHARGPEGFPVDHVLITDLIRTVKGCVTGIAVGFFVGFAVWILHKIDFGSESLWYVLSLVVAARTRGGVLDLPGMKIRIFGFTGKPSVR